MLINFINFHFIIIIIIHNFILPLVVVILLLIPLLLNIIVVIFIVNQIKFIINIRYLFVIKLGVYIPHSLVCF